MNIRIIIHCDFSAAIGDECDVVGDCVGLANIECKDPGWGVKQCLCVDNYAGDGNGNCARGKCVYKPR